MAVNFLPTPRGPQDISWVSKNWFELFTPVEREQGTGASNRFRFMLPTHQYREFHCFPHSSSSRLKFILIIIRLITL